MSDELHSQFAGFHARPSKEDIKECFDEYIDSNSIRLVNETKLSQRMTDLEIKHARLISSKREDDRDIKTMLKEFREFRKLYTDKESLNDTNKQVTDDNIRFIRDELIVKPRLSQSQSRAFPPISSQSQSQHESRHEYDRQPSSQFHHQTRFEDDYSQATQQRTSTANRAQASRFSSQRSKYQPKEETKSRKPPKAQYTRNYHFVKKKESADKYGGRFVETTKWKDPNIPSEFGRINDQEEELENTSVMKPTRKERMPSMLGSSGGFRRK